MKSLQCIREHFPPGTLVVFATPGISMLILSWSECLQYVAVLWGNGEIEFKRSSMSLKSLCPNSDIRGGFPIQFEIFSSHQQTTTT